MKARAVIGRRIVHISQTRIYDHSTGTWFTAIDTIVLDNGTRIEVSERGYQDGDGFCQDAAEVWLVKP